MSFSRKGRKRGLLSRALLDGELAAVVAAGAAYGVVDVPSAAVGANCQRGCYGLIVGSALARPGLRLSSFRMCHFCLYF